MFSKITQIITALTATFSMLVLIASFFFSWSWPAYLPGLLALVIALVSPQTALCLLMLLLPIFGNRPGSIHALIFIFICSGIISGLACRALISRHKKIETNNFDTNPPTFFAVLYGLASLFSLTALPPLALLQELKSFIDYSSINSTLTSFNFVLLTSEHTLLYSFLSVAFTWQALYLMLTVFKLAKQSQRFSIFFAFAIFFSLVHSLFIGLFDYYQIINLSSLRPLDPIVNPDQTQMRLQSWFAHSGWFAEYVTLVIPFVMLLLLLPIRFLLRASFILVILLIGELVLILSYQRGGWLSYPLTLLVVWLAIYVVYRLEKDDLNIFKAVKASALKVIISLPVTILISLGLVYSFNIGSGGNLNSYFERFKGIKNTSDRTDFIVSGYLIGLKHPVLGAASESYAYRYEQEFEDPSGNYYKRYNLPLHGSAHNVYAQTFAGKGLIGLIFMLAIVASLIFNTRAILADTLSKQQRLLILIGASFSIAFLIYGLVQEIFYINCLQILFFSIVGLSAAQVTSTDFQINLQLKRKATFLLFAALFLHIFWEYILTKEPQRLANYYDSIGCYRTETTKTGESFKWCRKRAFIKQAVQELLPKRFFVEFELAIPVIPSRHDKLMTVHIHSDFFDTYQTSLKPGSSQEISIELNKAPDDFRIPIEIIADNYFVPAKTWLGNQDLRMLSFQVR